MQCPISLNTKLDVHWFVINDKHFQDNLYETLDKSKIRNIFV